MSGFSDLGGFRYLVRHDGRPRSQAGRLEKTEQADQGWSGAISPLGAAASVLNLNGKARHSVLQRLSESAIVIMLLTVINQTNRDFGRQP
jgi:hypothetical protein